MRDVGNNENPDQPVSDTAAVAKAQSGLLQRLEDKLETPMLVLAFVWLALLIAELIRGESRLFEIIGAVIWVIFIIDFGVKLFLATGKLAYFKRNWLVALSLLLPALRVFRVLRAFRVLQMARVGRGLRLFRVVTSLNRGMGALRTSLSRRGFGYVIALTVLVAFAGAAGMYAFENGSPGGIQSYGEALWWTAMLLTTMGSQYWPLTVEGRLLCFFLALYAFAVFGYVTATLATYFVGRDAENENAEVAGSKQLAALREELVAMREAIQAIPGRAP